MGIGDSLPWGVDNVEKTYKIWSDNGGVINQLPDDQQAKMNAEFATLAEKLAAADPAVEEEYQRLKALVQAKSGK